MISIGYQCVIERLALNLAPLPRPSYVNPGVNARVDGERNILFPRSAAESLRGDTILDHLLFALRNEPISLPALAGSMSCLEKSVLESRLREAPNSEPLRKLGFFWEYFAGATLDVMLPMSATYAPLLDPDLYCVNNAGQRHPKFRITNNLLGTQNFCPVVLRSAEYDSALDRLRDAINQLGNRALNNSDLQRRAVDFMYLSETRSSFAIEKDALDSRRESPFLRLLHGIRAGEILTEDKLVELQNSVVRHDFAKEGGYRGQQNWLTNSADRISFLPHPSDGLQDTMDAWLDFVNAPAGQMNPIVKAACASFGFVYLHPFQDGNGRIHRYIIHHVLAQEGLVPDGVILPISSVILKNIPSYLATLESFSIPVTRLWDFQYGDERPIVNREAPLSEYRYFNASNECRFLLDMALLTAEKAVPNEFAYLVNYDRAIEAINAEFDLPNKEASLLVRVIVDNDMMLSKNKRKQFARIPDDVLDRIEVIVRDSFADSDDAPDRAPSF